ncbi:MAG TPA: type II toxin-antitoxin system VapC family toxin [Terriglobales bacterium]|nr:type II toxin-antitoxin system VapC family toxin [Terriglobales bacterium]
MSFLLDTNAVSEWVKPQPNPGLIAWMEATDEDRVYLSVITLVELRYGVDRLPASKKRKRLEDWLENELPFRFEARILDIDSKIAHACGRMIARREAIGRPLEVMDALLAATAEVHGLTVITRNNSDFEGVAQCLNPWT